MVNCTVEFLFAEQKCERPVDPANGNVISRARNQKLFNPGEKVWFKCDDGFDLVGAKDFVCQRDGNWRPQPFPRCVRRSELSFSCFF